MVAICGLNMEVSFRAVFDYGVIDARNGASVRVKNQENLPE
jgi:hypothetical protein